MKRLLLRSSFVAVFAVGCGGSNNQEAKAPPAEPPPSQTATAPGSPGDNPTGVSSEKSHSSSDVSSATSGPGSTTGSGSANPPPAQGANVGGATSGTGATSAPGGSGSDTGAIGGGVPSALNDDQILQVLHTANAGQIEQAKLAQKKSKNGEIKHFAAMMVKDHTDAEHKGQTVAKKTQSTPTQSPVAASLETDGRQVTSSLSAENGADFDRAYIEAQVKQHQQVLDLIDSQLLPNAKSSEVKNLVQTVRATVQSHWKEAQDIQRKLTGS